MADLHEEPDEDEERPFSAISRGFGGFLGAFSVRKPKGSQNGCKACGKPVLIQIFKGEDWCSDDCRKVLQGEV